MYEKILKFNYKSTRFEVATGDQKNIPYCKQDKDYNTTFGQKQIILIITYFKIHKEKRKLTISTIIQAPNKLES